MQYRDEHLETRVMTASREQLHLMVIDGALRHAQVATKALSAGDREGAWQSLSECRAHVAELLSGLAESDAEPIDNTRALFKFAYRELMLADVEQSVARVSSAVEVLKAHRETWVELIAILAKLGTADGDANGTDGEIRIGA